MLRNFVFALLAANVLYFAWSWWGGEDKPVLTAVVSRPTPARVMPPPPPPCSTVGPFIDESLAGMAQSRLEGAGLGAQRREATAEINDGWWVYVTSADAAAQRRTLDTIRRAGQRDAFAMPDDPEFRVSVGVFSDQKRAEDSAAKVQGLQLDAVVEQRHKQQSEVWFDVPGVAPAALGDGRLDDLDLPLLDLRIETCPAP